MSKLLNIINRSDLKHFVAASMDRYAPTNLMFEIITEELLVDIESEMISVAIKKSKEFRQQNIKNSNTKKFIKNASEGKRIHD